MEEIRGLVDETVKDPETADKLKAYYNQFCKRPTFNDHYLATFNRDNVELVDSATQGVEAITSAALSLMAKNLRWTASFTRADLRSRPAMSGVLAFPSLAWEVNPFTSTGRMACAACMAQW